MQIISGKAQLLHALAGKQISRPRQEVFCTGLRKLDDLAPDGEFRCGAVHELLWDPQLACPASLALLLARSAQSAMEGRGGIIVWSDPKRELYPPALAGMGVDLRRLILLRPRTRNEELWSVAECLRCRGVCATIVSVGRLSQIEARRLQLAAEAGGRVGLFLRPWVPREITCYAAATRWRVRPVPGGELSQRWDVELVHGHGGRVGSSVLLEVDRETGKASVVRASASVADRPVAAPPDRASA